MSRMPGIHKREDLDPEGQKVFDEIIGSRGQVTGPYTVLLYSPGLASRVAHLGQRIRFQTSLPPRLQEMAVLAATSIAECRFAWIVNSRHAAADGVDDATVDALKRQDPSAFSSEEDRRLFALAKGLLVDHRIDDELFNYWKDAIGPEQLVDLMGAIGYYTMLSVVLNGFGVDEYSGFGKERPKA